MQDEPQDPTPPIGPGSRISHYRILGEIGRGGMGVVYRAKDLNLDREVALKCVRPDKAGIPDLKKRLMREARAVSRLSHPAIVTILEILEHEGTSWIAMELVEGKSLRATLIERGPLPILELLGYAVDLSDALRAAHVKLVLHRDVNPNNVLISVDGRARLTDFGLAQFLVGPGRDSRKTTITYDESTGRVMGTPGYTSPEQTLGEPLDQRSDIFSFGAVLYEMCTAKPAFTGSTAGEVTDAILHREPPAIPRLNSKVPPELDRIISKAIAKRPDERYQDAREILADLRALRRRIETGETSRILAPPDPPRRARAWKIARLVLACLAAAGVIGVIVTCWPTDALPSTSSRQLTSGPAWESEPEISPDGSLIAYTSGESGNADVWVMDVHGGSPLRLTQDPATDASPSWFPDGSALVFASERGGESAIWRVPRLGGAQVLIVPNACEPAISRDGSRIAFARPGPSGRLRIYVADLSDPGAARPLTGDDDGLWDHRHPAWSPDGATLCYEDFKDLWLVGSDGGKARRLTRDQATDQEAVWSPSGRFVYFSSLREGSRALWRVAATGKRLERITHGTGPEGHPSLARNRSRLVYTTHINERHITLLDRRTGERTPLPSLRQDSSPAIAPGLGRIIFASDWQGEFDMWAQPLIDGRPKGGLERLTEHPGRVATIAVSPDGRWIAYHRVLEGQRDIWILPSHGGASTNLTSDPAVDVYPAWSPDGSKLAFVSNRDGHFHVWVQPVAEGRSAGPPRQITFGASTEFVPAWSRDGSQMALVRDTGSSSDVWIMSVDGGAAPRRVTEGAGAACVRWDAAAPALLVSGLWGGTQIEIRRVLAEGGAAEPFVPPVVCGDQDSLGEFDLSPGGEVIAFVEERNRGDLWSLEATSGSF